MSFFRLTQAEFSDFKYDGKERSVLHIAAINNHISIVKSIIPHFPNINMIDIEGATPLMLALSFKNADIAKMLLGTGKASVNSHNDKYGLPFNLAV